MPFGIGRSLKKHAKRIGSAIANPTLAFHSEATRGTALAPKNIYRTLETTVKNPSDVFKYLTPDYLRGSLFNPMGGGELSAGANALDAQHQADTNRPNFSAMSDQDLYRGQSEGLYRPSNPFEAENYDAFGRAYNARNRPRVYSTDDSFVFPDTEPTRPNTALIPSTAQPAVVGGGAAGGSPLAAGPQFGPEVTAQTGMPGFSGAKPGDRDTVAAQFKIPSQRRSKKTL